MASLRGALALASPAFTKAAKNSATRLLGAERALKLCRRFGDYRLNFDLASIDAEYDTERGLIDAKNYNSHVYRAAYSNNAPVTELCRRGTRKDGGLGHAVSYVPYVKGQSSAVVYNFFRGNYGIKDPVIYRASVADNDRVYRTKQFVLASNAVELVDDPARKEWDGEGAGEPLPDVGMLIVEAYHPRISVLSNQLRFIGFYTNQDARRLCGVHSMPLNYDRIVPAIDQGQRSWGPEQFRYLYCSATSSRISTDKGAKTPVTSRGEALVRVQGRDRSSAGYILMFDDKSDLYSVWHDDHANHMVGVKAGTGSNTERVQAFFVPDFKSNAPLVLVSKNQIGFQPTSIAIELYDDRSGSLVVSKDVDIGDDMSTVDLKALFDGAPVAGPLNVVTRLRADQAFTKEPTCMLHTYYRAGDTIADQVHSHQSYGFHNDFNPKFGAYRCRKFAPLVLHDHHDWYYSVINKGGNGPNRDCALTMRIFTDKGNEHIIQQKVSPDGVTNFRHTEILDQIGRSSLMRTAIIQIEAETTNYNGTWCAVDRRTQHMATDHFTGG